MKQESPAPGIIIENAHLSFAGRVVFENLSRQFSANRWHCILGTSGVGKSSLLRLIAGLRWSEAETDLAGFVRASDGASLDDRIAYMAQQDLLLPWLSVLDNVMLGHRLRAAQSIAVKQKALELLERVGLLEAAHLKPAQLSGGMRQRVALIRTLMEERPVILMDEPFSMLDAITRLSLQTIAAELLQDRTVILITHDPFEALRIGHEIYVMAGQPACLYHETSLTDPTPRTLDHQNLMMLHEQLLQRLTHG